MKLYMLQGSPPVRAVLMLADTLNIQLECVEVNFFEGEHLKPEFLKLNPQHTIPTLVDGDVVICDSHAIMSYLIGIHAPQRNDLYPCGTKDDVVRRALIDQRMYFDAGAMFCHLRGMMFAKISNKPINEQNVEAVQAGYKFLDAFLGRSKYVAGDTLTIADYSLIATVTSLNLLVPIDASLSKVHEWIKRCEGEEWYRINRDGLHKLVELIERIENRHNDNKKKP